jgi:hypothetical protein
MPENADGDEEEEGLLPVATCDWAAAAIVVTTPRVMIPVDEAEKPSVG